MRKDHRGRKRLDVDAAREIIEREFAELYSFHIQANLATEFLRTVFAEHVEKIRFMARLSAEVVSAETDLFICVEVAKGKLAVLASFSSKQVRLPLQGERPEVAELQEARDKSVLAVQTVLKVCAKEQSAANLASLLPAPLLEPIKSLRSDLPSEPFVIDIEGAPMLVPAKPKEPLVATSDEVFTDCTIMTIKVDEYAKVRATSVKTGVASTLNVTLRDDPVAAARLRLLACTRTRFSLTARAVQKSATELTFFPVEVCPLGAVANQLRQLMRQAALEV